MTDIESFDQNHEVSPKSRRTESSSVYEEAVDTTYQYLQQQLPQQPTNTSIISKNSSNEAIQCQLNFHSYQIILRLHCLLITELQPNSPSVNSQRGHSKSPSKIHIFQPEMNQLKKI